MTIALSVLMKGFGDLTREMYIPRSQFKGTADTAGLVTALKDTELNVFADDYFNSVYWVYITSGAAIGNIRNISDFTQVGGIITPDINFSAAPLADSGYQIWKCHTQDVIDAINEAIISLWAMPPAPWLFRKIVFESLGQDDLVNNAAAAQAVVEITDDTLFFVGQKVTVEDDNASEDATIESIDATTNKLTMEDNLTNSYTTAANAKVVAKSGKYFNLGATIGDARITGVYTRADSVSIRKQYTNFNIIQSLAGVRQIYFPSSASVDDQTWIIEAIDKLEAVTTPASTITLEDRRVKLLYAMTAYHYYDRQANDISSGNFERLEALALKYWNLTQTIYRHLRMALPIEVVHLEYDSDSD